MPLIRPYGSGAWFVELELSDEAERGARTRQLARAVERWLPGADVVVGAGVLGVFDLEPSESLERELDELLLAELARPLERGTNGRLHELSVVYDGPDLEEVARAAGLTRQQLIELHTAPLYTVELLGFLPGFAYLSGGDERLRLPRRSSPRPRVAAGSLAIAAGFTGIYPFDSPGGWHLLGRALDQDWFDAEREPPARLLAGDAVRFVPRTAEQAGPVPPRLRRFPPSATSARALSLVRVSGSATVQDRGRPGQLRWGLPSSGALDPATFQAAHRVLGNPEDAAQLELLLGGVEVEAHGELWVSLDGAAPVRLADGQRFVVEPSDRAVRYLAVEGGLDVPVQRGSRSTLLVARLGGHQGRALRPGDRLNVGSAPADRPKLAGFDEPGSAEPLTLVVDPGPHLGLVGQTAWETLTGEPFVVSQLLDRVGVRLEGPALGAGQELPAPVPLRRGAIQIASGGQALVMGPDHPVTGGYPQLALLAPEAWSGLARQRPGRTVRFRPR